MKRSEVLDTAKAFVTADRQADHGKPEDTFGLIADLWSAYLGKDITSADVAWLMILLKVARARMNPSNADNAIDAAGYAACAAELVEE